MLAAKVLLYNWYITPLSEFKTWILVAAKPEQIEVLSGLTTKLELGVTHTTGVGSWATLEQVKPLLDLTVIVAPAYKVFSIKVIVHTPPATVAEAGDVSAKSRYNGQPSINNVTVSPFVPVPVIVKLFSIIGFGVIVATFEFCVPTATPADIGLGDLHSTEFVACAVIIDPGAIFKLVNCQVPPVTAVVPTEIPSSKTVIVVPFVSDEVPDTVVVVPQ